VDIVGLITPDVLIAAAEAGNCDVIRFLVGLSPNVGFSNSIGMSALHAAAWKGCVDTCWLLLELGCPVNSSPATDNSDDEASSEKSGNSEDDSRTHYDDGDDLDNDTTGSKGTIQASYIDC